MRVSRQQVLENKRTIMEAAGRLFRARGFETVTVTDVMKSAGLTHGGFYSYFKSKDDLIAQTLAELQGGTEPLTADLATLGEQYLTLEHRDNFACGCPVAALASETIHQPGGARAEMTAGLKRQIDRLSQVAPGSDQAHRRRAAIGSWAAMVGALILARMSDDRELSEEVLSQTREWLAAQDRKGRNPCGGSS
ncbi:putative Transcriptional regulator, TetR family [Bradyrhizobium sp. ORS 285]|uniref:TetR/AcrR family transcriptional regulator n=1 Tax=Bradyrhizobium sp. ORS 285 TaxID=115808 RepID=UPI0002406277|nr:TetR/AcrR family transcriptional regulator [Bradyrhizobium sp. ORS 285]CCD89489.1 putative Transcriptional regulator, TetR family [Bradyrhizobium sp. ORS 285]SMX58737.1 putative Transcriptional regulator, TetR family [Bradyrhizobium sp. ORS 285]